MAAEGSVVGREYRGCGWQAYVKSFRRVMSPRGCGQALSVKGFKNEGSLEMCECWCGTVRDNGR